MKRIAIAALVIAAVLMTCPLMGASAKGGSELRLPAPGQKFVSPDKRFVVWLDAKADDPYAYQYRMEDRETGEIAKDIDTVTTVSALYWTGDSRTVVAMVLLAGGPQPQLLHLQDVGLWSANFVTPPSMGQQKYCVVLCKPIERKVHFTFGIRRNFTYYRDGNQYLCSFDVEPDSGMFSDMKWTEISLKDYSLVVRNYFIEP